LTALAGPSPLLGVSSARSEAYLAANDPARRTSCKVIGKNDLRAQLRVLASRLSQRIRANRDVSDAQLIGLGLNVRKAWSRLGEPGKPQQLRADLTGAGGLKLKWKCKHPPGARGTIYQLWRRIDGGEREYLGGVGVKWYVDEKLPRGLMQVTYEIQAVRSTAKGPVATFTVNFGSGAAIRRAATMTPPAQGAKIAA
jgi:hypothetical protein